MKRRVFLLVLGLAWISQALSAFPQAGRFGLRLIVVETEAEAVDLVSLFESGQRFEDLARQHSIDPSGPGGGYLGTVAIEELRPEFQNGLAGLGPGQVSPVIRLGREYALLQLLSAEQPGGAAFVEAAARGDVAQLETMLDDGVDVNISLGDGSTALIAAASTGQLEVVNFLLEAHADANAAAGVGATAVMIAAQRGYAEIVRALVAAGADLDRRAGNGSTALIEAALGGHADMVRILLDAGAEVDAKFADGSTALFGAAQTGNTEIVRVLVAGGGDVNARAANGSTPLLEAAFPGHSDTARLLLEAGADPDASLDDGSTVLMKAALGGHGEVVEALVAAGANVNASADNGRTALMESAYAGGLDVARILLGAGADSNASLDDGSTALMAAAFGGHADIVGMLLDVGADPEPQDGKGWTALTYAAASANSATVIALLEADGGVRSQERHLLLGSTYVNEYYSSNDPLLLDRAAVELRQALDADANDSQALEWAAAVEFLRWGERPDFKQFRAANALLQRSVALDPDDRDRHYWIAATDATFVTRGSGASRAELAAVVDEGIEHAGRAVELDPLDPDAVAVLAQLYRHKAQAATTRAARDRLRQIADSANRDALRLRTEREDQPPARDDQFSRPAPPPPPE